MPRHKLSDMIELLPGILGKVLQRDGHPVWAPTVGGALRALWTLGCSLKELWLESDPPDRDDLGDSVVATRLIPGAHLIPACGASTATWPSR